jgi:hypothetical protein
VECHSGDIVALGEPGLAFRVMTVPTEQQRSAVDAALALLPPPTVRACALWLHASCLRKWSTSHVLTSRQWLQAVLRHTSIKVAYGHIASVYKAAQVATMACTSDVQSSAP